jgi:hypothetical protein
MFTLAGAEKVCLEQLSNTAAGNRERPHNANDCLIKSFLSIDLNFDSAN